MNLIPVCFVILLRFQVNKNLTPLLQKCQEKKIGYALRHENFFNIKKHLALVLKKNVAVLFCVFETNLNKEVDIICKLSEWIRNIQMIHCFNTIKTWMRILHG